VPGIDRMVELAEDGLIGPVDGAPDEEAEPKAKRPGRPKKERPSSLPKAPPRKRGEPMPKFAFELMAKPLVSVDRMVKKNG